MYNDVPNRDCMRIRYTRSRSHIIVDETAVPKLLLKVASTIELRQNILNKKFQTNYCRLI